MSHRYKRDMDRLNFFSDGVFAIIITILVLELHPPHEASLSALIALWPSAVSYAVSYVFLAIVWVNHHHLLRFATETTGRLVWANFAHLFTVSLVPFATAWLAKTGIAGLAVSVYALVFAAVNLTYMGLCRETIHRRAGPDSSRRRRFMRIRPPLTLAIFTLAVVVGLAYPIGGIGLVLVALIFYVQPGSADEAFESAETR